MTDPTIRDARERVLEWFGRAGRGLPWRATRDPYRVLVAEMLAQQTQAARAAAAWPRFLERFPDVEALAAATPAEVLRAWQGIGYNRRAIALQAAARAVVERGGWPDTVEGLAALPGVGPYTARAVACFALGQQVAPVDTNVARVLARALTGGDPGDLGPAARQRLADEAMPPGRAWEWSSALMDVGALHCRPQPRCQGCPLAPGCRWRALGPAAPRHRPRTQAPFATSDRRWRGAVVRALASAPEGLEAAVLAEEVEAGAAGRPAGWFERLLMRLEEDGMVVRASDGRVRLPG
ncbi:MAG TPA: A/G-specific adenine glycosylase [Actinomycetes bacterium]|nr:A/G-specific adenine glycosylase [Actinomycetes bacterium]